MFYNLQPSLSLLFFSFLHACMPTQNTQWAILSRIEYQSDEQQVYTDYSIATLRQCHMRWLIVPKNSQHQRAGTAPCSWNLSYQCCIAQPALPVMLIASKPCSHMTKQKPYKNAWKCTTITIASSSVLHIKAIPCTAHLWLCMWIQEMWTEYWL